MGLKCGIVGLPNVGKSTIFSALTKKDVGVANFPFCTIDPNVGIVEVPDKRLDQLKDINKSQKIIPTTMEFVDIAGLVKGANEGEGLGNQFLGHIREVDVILHVVRCFQDDDITHVHGKMDPLDDMEVINTELALADLSTIEKRISNLKKLFKHSGRETSKEDKILLPILEKAKNLLEAGETMLFNHLDEEELLACKSVHLLALKKQLIVCNVDDLNDKNNEHVNKIHNFSHERNIEYVLISGKIEQELLELSEEDKIEFMSELGMKQSGLDTLIQKSYEFLGLETYFTSGEKETRAWTVKMGTLAPAAAGIIHTDFEKGFIKAEVYSCKDLFDQGTVAKLKESGKMRLEGKNYTVQDGDVINFRFNV